MWQTVRLFIALTSCVAGGAASAWAADTRSQPDGLGQPTLRFAFSAESPLVTRAGGIESLESGVPGAYVSAMTLYRVALASGLQPPLVASDRVYGDELAGPLQWTWATENGDVVTRVARGIFRLSFEADRSDWFRELDCRMVTWPGGDQQAVMQCDDGTERRMTVPSDGVVMIDDVAYTRLFQREPLPPEEDIMMIELDEGSQSVE